MTEKQQIRIDLLSECLEQYGVKLTEDQLLSISNDMTYHIEMEREMDGYYHSRPSKETCQSCEGLKREIKSLEKDICIYRNSVKERRNAEHVWLDGDRVMYE